MKTSVDTSENLRKTFSTLNRERQNLGIKGLVSGSGNLDCGWSEMLGERPGEYHQFELSFLTSRGAWGAHGAAASFPFSPRLNVTLA